MNRESVHSFHIPVMATGFTIDTPLRVARYGISSVISLVDDLLIEQMRKFYSEKEGIPYTEITAQDKDARAHRITAYLNLVNRMVQTQVRELKNSPFEEGSQITRYYKMLPETPLKQLYQEMLKTSDPLEKERMQEKLRRHVVPGNIDVNIMTKLDRDIYYNGEKLSHEFADALAALRGYANSTLDSSVVFSAGINPRLYTYIAQFDDFFPDEKGSLKKKIILKVSDYRSAVVQSKFLAKRGLWVSEYRIESGLNCGGHAFATKGNLLGPILEEFKRKKKELLEKLHKVYSKALAKRCRFLNEFPYKTRVTVQGGIGTADEDRFLRKYYEVDGTGWGSPFLLVPEVTNVDEAHLKKLISATDTDVFLSDSSPLGIPFWNLRTSGSEEARRQRIREGKPGSLCPKGHAKLNTEFTPIPICPSSSAYQKLKLQRLQKESRLIKHFNEAKDKIFAKSCLCHDLAGGATLKYNIDVNATPAVCSGPNILNFSRIATLEEMVSHIYGRLSILTNHNRPHMFIKELSLYIEYFRKEKEEFSLGILTKTPKYFREFKENLINGIEYYRRLAEQLVEEQRERFLQDLKALRKEFDLIFSATPVEIYAENEV